MDISNRVVVTVVGKDKKGIIATISSELAENQANILDISQTILQDFFTMVMVIDITDCLVDFKTLCDTLALKGQDIGVVVSCQHEEIFQYMHRV